MVVEGVITQKLKQLSSEGIASSFKKKLSIHIHENTYIYIYVHENSGVNRGKGIRFRQSWL